MGGRKICSNDCYYIFLLLHILAKFLWLICYRNTYLYINSGRWYLSHVPSTFATVNTHANVFFVFLPGGISKEWRQILSANCDFEGEPSPIVPMFTGLSGNTWETTKIAHESHNDVQASLLAPSSFCWAAKGPVIFTGCS